jgi:ribonuclease HI
MPSFTCSQCGNDFEVPQAALDRYPGWTPKKCRRCKPAKSAAAAARTKPRSRRAAAEENLSVAEVLDKYKEGPTSGVFTDGAADPNPGPGGWGAVYVIDDRIVDEAHGHEPHTTNNRMELTALIAGYRMVPRSRRVVVWSDSELCVNTITKWAPGWAARGWRRKGGEIKNLDLVQELHALAQERPGIELRWIKAHSGLRWNEYADALATAYRRTTK